MVAYDENGIILFCVENIIIPVKIQKESTSYDCGLFFIPFSFTW
jgi:hypothetical protein